jgi:hypothetical protein
LSKTLKEIIKILYEIVDVDVEKPDVVQHSNLHVVPLHKPPPIAFGFNRV